MSSAILNKIENKLRSIADGLSGPSLERGTPGEVGFWEGSLTEGGYFSETILKRLTAEGRAELFFHREFQWIGDLVPRLRNEKFRLLDVGSGPLSTAAFLVDAQMADVVAVDPLAERYVDLCRRKLMHYPVIPVRGCAEALVALYGEKCFDMVFSENAIDHTQSPARAVREMVGVLRPGGVLAIKVRLKEGSNEKWLGFHKTDVWPDGCDLRYKFRFGRSHSLLTDQPLRHLFTIIGELYGESAMFACYQKLDPSLASRRPD